MKTFDEFWRFYIKQHTNKVNVWLHVLGTLLGATILIYSMMSDLRFIIGAPIMTYFFAWVGHFIFEKNKPATLSHPFFSIVGDLKLTVVTLKCLFCRRSR